MFSSALKSISSTISTNVSSNYSVSATAASSAGPWKIYEAKKKSTGKAYSVFVFDKKTVLDGYSSGLGRSSATAVKRAGEEVVERLKKEASSLARLRHPSVLELVEPVEETRGGGLQFVTEAVTTSLAGLLQHKDDQERSGGDAGGRSRRYVTEDADGTRRRREPEMDELEIQKGLLQISKALEFLHEKAGLCHANLTPDSILINTRGDWKLSGLSFCTPPENSSKPTSFQPINLAEVLHTDPRLPRFVQLNLDYTSPDFVLDKHLTSSADMFSLGLLCVALYNSPHRSPIESQGNTSTYKRLFQTSSTLPSANNDFLCTRPLPKDLSRYVLPRLITRRPAQRMTAKEFQQSEYFNNVLVSSIRFLEAFPAKTAKEKAQFLRGLLKVLPSFPKSVMEKKVLPALLEELKDRELVSLILHNVFKIIDLLPSGRRAFGDKIRPSLKEIFVTKAKQTQEKDAARDAGLMIMLEQLSVIVDNCNGKEFKDGTGFRDASDALDALADHGPSRYLAHHLRRIGRPDSLGGRRGAEEPAARFAGAGLQHHQERAISRHCYHLQPDDQSRHQGPGIAGLCHPLRRHLGSVGRRRARWHHDGQAKDVVLLGTGQVHHAREDCAVGERDQDQGAGRHDGRTPTAQGHRRSSRCRFRRYGYPPHSLEHEPGSSPRLETVPGLHGPDPDIVAESGGGANQKAAGAPG